MAKDDSFLALKTKSSMKASDRALATIISSGESIAEVNFFLIEQAKREIISLEFLLRDDEFGLMKMALLRQKVRQGRRVLVHVDAFHLMASPALVRHLMDEGVEFSIFNKLTLKSFPKMSYRNHSKGLIIDGSIFKTGDSNTGDEYVHWNMDGFHMKCLDVVIEGPIACEARKYAFDLMRSPLAQAPRFKIASAEKVQDQRKQIRTLIKLTKVFFRTLYVQMDAPEHIARPECIFLTESEVQQAQRQLDEAENRYLSFKLNRNLSQWKKGTVSPSSMRFFCDPIENKSLCHGVNLAVLDFINHAQQLLCIVSPYLILTDDMKNAICKALKRGVKIQFFTNSLNSTDNHTTQMAYEYRFKEMAHLGSLEIFEYQGPETLHAKFMVRDQACSMIMTYNIDWRSESKNLETAVEFDGPLIAENLSNWVQDHKNKFSLVANQGIIHKDLVRSLSAADIIKKIVILSIEKHL